MEVNRLLFQYKNFSSTALYLLFIMVLVLLVFTPITISCKETTKNSLDEVIVQVWEGDELISNGIVVGNGSQVLAILEYHDPIPDNLYVVQENTEYKALVKTVDFRTGLTLLEINGGPFKTVSTEDALSIKPGQRVLVYGWSQLFTGFEETAEGKRPLYGNPEFTKINAVTTDYTLAFPYRFGINYPTGTSLEEQVGIRMCQIVTDPKGNVLGFVGYSYWGLFPPPSPPGWLPPVVSISTALDLLSENANQQIWTRGPTGFIFAGPNYNTAYGQAPEYYDEAAIEIEKLLNTAEQPLSVAELNIKNYTSFYPSVGKAVTAEYALPVSIKNADGDLLAQAKWVFIRWGVIRQQVYVIYGTRLYSPEGAFKLSGDPTNLDLIELHPPRIEAVPP
jgi:hypothetical protein